MSTHARRPGRLGLRASLTLTSEDHVIGESQTDVGVTSMRYCQKCLGHVLAKIQGEKPKPISNKLLE